MHLPGLPGELPAMGAERTDSSQKLVESPISESVLSFPSGAPRNEPLYMAKEHISTPDNT